MIVHASLVARRIAGVWLGALIEGPSGAGKSDIVLRALDQGGVLAADDRVRLFVSEGRLYGAAPEPLEGLVEARGVGVVRTATLRLARVAIIVRCAAMEEAVERMPDPGRRDVLGVAVPVIEVHPFEASAPAKLRLALEHLGAAP
jgi:serine kinase of HPr protein (carbohydrate metabolism regulator)